MSNQIFQFAKATQALGNLGETIVRLDNILKNKAISLKESQKEQKNLLQKKEKEINSLQDNARQMLLNVDNIINQLDKVLETNVTSNSHN